MYKLIIKLVEITGDQEQIMHEAHSMERRSIQEAFMDYDGKELFEVYMGIQAHIIEELTKLGKKK